VIDDADDRKAYLRTAGMGKSALTAYVEAVCPQLDCAVLSVSEDTEHDRWFDKEEPEEWVRRITCVKLHNERITSETQKVFTIGFPQGLEEQLSSGWLAGRGSEDMDMLQLNISINSGNSGGALCDTKGRVIGMCTCTLSESEAIAFAVPAFSIRSYFEKFYTTDYGLFPRWGIKLMPMTDAFAARYDVRCRGAVVAEIEPGSPANRKLQVGDVIHTIRSGSVEARLDYFGLIIDSTRGSKITIHNTEFIMQLTPGQVFFDITRSGRAMTHELTPAVIPYKVADTWKEWCPTKVAVWGPIVFQNVSRTLLTDDEMDATCAVGIAEAVKRTHGMQELVMITRIEPNSYVKNYEIPRTFDLLIKVGRTRVKGIEHLNEIISDYNVRWKSGEKYMCLETSSGKVWLMLDQMFE
tara:strand:- start:1919 stop:3148 length:1230 start_codon:yes stop_codon:yes gene_type:complete